MAFLSKVFYSGTGSNFGPFTVTFPYLAEAHLEVYVDGSLKVQDVDYEFTTSSSITFLVTAPPSGTDNVEFRRATPTGRLVDYLDGGNLTEAKLDKDGNQLAFIMEEQVDELTSAIKLDDDGNMDALGNRIVNVGTPVDGTDAVTKTYADTLVAVPADDAVTLAKMAHETQGEIIFYGAAGAPSALAVGTAGQLLMTNGAAANPSWVTVNAAALGLGNTDFVFFSGIQSKPTFADPDRSFSVAGTDSPNVGNAVPERSPLDLEWGTASDHWVVGEPSDNMLFRGRAVVDHSTGDILGCDFRTTLAAGTSSAIVGGRFYATLDAGLTTPRGGSAIDATIFSSSGGALHASNFNVSVDTVAAAAVHGCEYGFFCTADVDARWGVAFNINSTDTADATVNLGIAGTTDTLPAEGAILIQSGAAANPWDNGIVSVQQDSGARPIGGNLWYSGGFTSDYGLNWGRMTGFNQAAILLPNNQSVKWFDNAGTAELDVLKVDTSDRLVLGTTAGILIPDGTVSAPALAFSDDTDTGIYSSSNNRVNIAGAGGIAFQATGVASGVDFWEVTASTTGQAPVLAVGGTDSTINAILRSKGTGTGFFFQNGSSQTQFHVNGVSASVNYLEVTGAATTSSPTLAAVGSDTNIDLPLVPQGTGVVQFGTHTAIGAETLTGYITIKDSGGTLRKIAVVS